jgi:hypothetical protein
MAHPSVEVMGTVKKILTYKESYEVNQQCRKRYFLQGIV